MKLTNIFIKFNSNTQRFNIEVYSGPDDDNLELDFEMSSFGIDLDKIAGYLMQETENLEGAWDKLAKIKGTDSLFIVFEGKYQTMLRGIIEKKYPQAVEYIYDEEAENEQEADES